MSERIRVGKAVLEFEVDDKGVVSGLKKVKDTVEQAGTGLSAKAIAVGASFGTFIGGMAKDAVMALGRQMVELGTRGVQLSPMAASFKSLTASIGQSGDAMLQVSRTASKGLITDMDLMAAANKAILLGLPVTSQSMGTMAQAAVALGRAMKQDATKSFDDLITALGRSSPMILDNLGLSVKVEEANQKYAASIKKSASELTDAEKKLAFYNAAMDAAKRKVDEVGGIQLTFADRLTQVKVAMSNFTDALGVAIATSPVVNAAFEAVSSALTGAFGENQTTLVQTLVQWVNWFALRLVEAGQVGVMVGRALGSGFAAIRTVFYGVATALSAVIVGMSAGVTTVLRIASFVPGMGDSLKGAIAAAEGFTQKTIESGRELAGMTAEAAKGVIGQDAFGQALTRSAEVLGVMKGKMEAAAQQTVSTDAIARQLTQTTAEQGEQTKKTAEEVKKATQEVDRQRAALSSMGLVTEREVNAALNELGTLLGRALAEGVPYDAFLQASIAHLEELAEKAQKAGIKIPALTAKITELGQALQWFRGGAPSLSASLFSSDAIDRLVAQTRSISAEQMAAQHQVFLTSRAFEFFGITASASLREMARTARARFEELKQSGVATAEELKIALDKVTAAEAAAAGKASQWKTSLDSVAASFQSLSQTAGGALSSVTRWLGTALSSVSQLTTSWKEMFSGKGFAATLSGITGVVGAISQGIALAQQLGKALHDAFTRSEAEKIAADLRRGFGLTNIAEDSALTKQIEELMKKLKTDRNTAIELSLPDIIKASGLTAENFANFAGRATELFDNIRRGGAVGAASLAALDDTLGLLGDHLTAQGGLWDTHFLAMIERAQAEGLELASVARLMEEQLGKAAAGINKVTQAFGNTDQIKKITELLAEQKKIAEDVAKSDRGPSDSQKKRLAEISAQLVDLRSNVIANQDEFDRLSRMSLAAFNVMVREGKSTVEIMAALKPSIDSLRSGMEALGLTGNAAFDQLARLSDLTTANAPLLESIGGLNELLTAMANLGALDAQTFADIQAQGLAAFEKLTAAGFTEQEALTQMAPMLATLRDLHLEKGMAIDEATAALIRQAEEQGILAAKEESVQDVLMDGLGAIIELLGGTLPDAWKKMAKDAKQAADEVEKAFEDIKPVIKIEYDYPEMEQNPGGEPNEGAPNEGYAWGTPNLDFKRFERGGRPVTVHGDEAIIPRGKGHELGAEVASAIAPLLAGSGSSAAQGDVVLMMDREIVGRIIAKAKATQDELAKSIALNTFGMGTAVRGAAR